MHSMDAVLKTGTHFRDLPMANPSATTCSRRLHDWEEHHLWRKIWSVFLNKLGARRKLDWCQCFIDGSIAPDKNGRSPRASPAKPKARSGWCWATAQALL